jgi:Xaa-Pro aminopeptidase
MTAYTRVQRSGDAEQPFSQEAKFWSLTGINEADWQLIIDSAGKSFLVAPGITEVDRIFNGGMSGDQAMKVSGVDTVLSRDEADVMLGKMAERGSPIYSLGEDPHATYYSFALNPAPVHLLAQLKRMFSEVKDCRIMLARLRAIKQPEEIVAIKQAIQLTMDAFSYVKNTLESYQHEYEVEAAFSHYFRSHGAQGHAYDPIVAAGSHACTLHYNTNNDPLASDHLLLLDIGALVGGYAADITRTYAIGAPTKRMKDVHSAVKRAHEEIIHLLAPGVTIRSYHEAVDSIMKRELMELKLIDSLDDSRYRKYFPHAVSHGLGIDVHDSLGNTDQLKQGMILTVEPGIYIPEEGIGVRIEDDILITKDGFENLSATLSREL